MLDELVELDRKAWGEEMAATREMLQSRMTIHPQGNYVALHQRTNKIVGSVWTMWIENLPIQSWMKTTGDGFYAATFSPYGDVMFGVNICVDRDVIDVPVGPFLLNRAIELAWASGRKFARLGARMPSYCKWSHVFSAEDYIHLYRAGDHIYAKDPAYHFLREGGTFSELKKAQEAGHCLNPWDWPIVAGPKREVLTPFDFELAFFTNVFVRGQRLEITELLPEYFEDPESLNNGVLLQWRNPDLL